MAEQMQLAARAASHSSKATHDPVAALDARFDALDELIKRSTADSCEKRKRRISRRALAAAVRRALWKLAADPRTAEAIQEAIVAEPQPVRTAGPTDYAEVLQLLSAQAGFRPLPLRPRHPVGNALGIIDEQLDRLVLVVESAPDGSARFRIPTVRSARLESILCEAFGLTF